jgi:hypothetical protein
MLSSMLRMMPAGSATSTPHVGLFERGYADFIVGPFRITAENSPRFTQANNRRPLHRQSRRIPHRRHLRTESASRMARANPHRGAPVRPRCHGMDVLYVQRLWYGGGRRA